MSIKYSCQRPETGFQFKDINTFQLLSDPLIQQIKLKGLVLHFGTIKRLVQSSRGTVMVQTLGKTQKCTPPAKGLLFLNSLPEALSINLSNLTAVSFDGERLISSTPWTKSEKRTGAPEPARLNYTVACLRTSYDTLDDSKHLECTVNM